MNKSDIAGLMVIARIQQTKAIFWYVLPLLGFLYISSGLCQTNDEHILQIEGYILGEKIDTAQVIQIRKISFPNYLDGWNYQNINQLPPYLSGLPVAIYKLKTNENIRFTLLENRIIRILSIKYSENEKDSIIAIFTEKLQKKPKFTSYKNIDSEAEFGTVWQLYTWQPGNVIIQVGTSYIKKEDSDQKRVKLWDLLYTDLEFELQIIEDFMSKKK